MPAGRPSYEDAPLFGKGEVWFGGGKIVTGTDNPCRVVRSLDDAIAVASEWLGDKQLQIHIGAKR